MSTSRYFKGIALSVTLIVIISGCSGQEAKSVKGEVHNEYVDLTELEDTTLVGQRTLKVEGLKAQFEEEWKVEQERIAKEKVEAERKAKEEAEAKEKAEAEEEAKANPANMGAVEKAQWENNNFSDVHERANYLVANPNHLNNVVGDDTVTMTYLNTLNDDLQFSGELQTETILNGEMGALE